MCTEQFCKQPFPYLNQSFKIITATKKQTNSETFTDSIEQFTTTSVFNEKIF